MGPKAGLDILKKRKNLLSLPGLDGVNANFCSHTFKIPSVGGATCISEDAKLGFVWFHQ